MSIMLSIYSRIDQLKFLPFAWFILIENLGLFRLRRTLLPRVILAPLPKSFPWNPHFFVSLSALSALPGPFRNSSHLSLGSFSQLNYSSKSFCFRLCSRENIDYLISLFLRSSSVKQVLCCCSLYQSCNPMDTRVPCPSLSLGVYSNSCPLSRWCHPTISFSVAPFSCLQCFPANREYLCQFHKVCINVS